MKNINNKFYVLLTGSKNNAGDFLIKFRAKEIFKKYRPDREVVDINAWEVFDEEKLNLVNQAEALILMGGPALQKKMYPNIYPLTNLDDIHVPIVAMGIGWKSLNGAWENTRNYALSDDTKLLLKKIEASGFKSSVRDYHTLNSLQSHNFNNFVMTGCPALNSIEHNMLPDLELTKIKKVAFSLGVSFIESSEMAGQMKALIMKLAQKYSAIEFEVVFHHSLSKSFLNTHNATNKHLTGHKEFEAWLLNNRIKYVDISGSAERLISYYEKVNLHIGYRVHAHIFMSSIGKRSLLISEDGRGKALKSVIGGAIFDAFDSINQNFLSRVLRRLKLSSGYKVTPSLADEVVRNLDYEVNNNYPRMRASKYLIKENFKEMESFLLQLP